MSQQEQEALRIDVEEDEVGGAIVLSSEDALAIARETYELTPREERYEGYYADLVQLAESGEFEQLIEIQDLVLNLTQVDNSTTTLNRIDNSDHSITDNSTTYHSLTYQPFTYIDNSSHTTIFYSDTSQHHDNSHNRTRSGGGDGGGRCKGDGDGGGSNHQLLDFLVVVCVVAFCAVMFVAAFGQLVTPSNTPDRIGGVQ